MNEPTPSDSVLVFATEADQNFGPRAPAEAWRLLIVDDEPSVHEVTELALSDFEYCGRRLRFLHAHSAQEARHILEAERDVAVAIVDVVMETDHAGLELVHWIRQDLGDSLIRLILRTGQPGRAPERSVIHDYEINDYREKADLTAQRLYTSVLTSLRSYSDLRALEAGRRSLENIIRAIGHVHDAPGLTGFVQGALEQLIALLRLDGDAMFVIRDGEGNAAIDESAAVVAATGRLAPLVDSRTPEQWPADAAATVQEAMQRKGSTQHDGSYGGYVRASSGRESVLYIASSGALSEDETKLIRLFLSSVSIAYDKALPRHAP